MTIEDIARIIENEPKDTNLQPSQDASFNRIDAIIKAEKAQEANVPQQSFYQRHLPESVQLFNIGAAQNIADIPYQLNRLLARTGLIRKGSLADVYAPKFNLGTQEQLQSTPAQLGGFAADIGVGAAMPSMALEKALPTLAAKAPSLIAGLNVAPSSALFGAMKAAPDPNASIPSYAATGAIGGAGISAALSKVLPLIFTSRASPINIIDKAKPAVQDLASGIKESLIGNSEISPNNISDELFKRVSRVYDEFKGNLPSGEPNIYVHPDNTAPAIYAKTQMQGKQLGKIDNSGVKDAVQKEINNYKNQMEAMDSNDPLYSKYSSYIKQLQSYLPRAEEAKAPEGRRLNSFDDFDLFKRNLNNSIRGLGNEDIPLKQSLSNIKQETHSAIDNVLKPADEQYRGFMSLFENNRENIRKKSPFINLYNQADSKTENFLPSYIQAGTQKDKVSNIQNLMDMLPDDESKKLAGAWWLKDAQTPQDMVSQYNKLGVNQKNTLFNPDARKGLDALNVLRTKHSALFDKTPSLVDRPGSLLGQFGAGALAAAHGNPLAASLLLAHPIGQSAMQAIPTENLINKFVNLKLKQSATPNVFSKAMSAVIPTAWSRLRGY